MREIGEDDLSLGIRALGDEVQVEGDLQRVRAKARRSRRRRRVGYLAAAVAVLAAAGASAFAFRGGGTSAERVVAGAECDVVNDGVPTFPQFAEGAAPHGRPGDTITVAGSGFYAPAKRVEVIWNKTQEGLAGGPRQQAGPSFVAARDAVALGCRFRVELVVPDVPPGEYSVVVRIYDPNSTFAVASERAFVVVA